MNAAQTIQTSPIHLVVGDNVLSHGAMLEVVHIRETACDVPSGVRVAACISRLVGEDMGSIPKHWFETPESMIKRGCGDWTKELPAGLYWNVQGNAHAAVLKVIQ